MRPLSEHQQTRLHRNCCAYSTASIRAAGSKIRTVAAGIQALTGCQVCPKVASALRGLWTLIAALPAAHLYLRQKAWL